MDRLECLVEHVVYQNKDNGYSVMRATAKGYGEFVSLVGYFAGVVAGTNLEVFGEWKNNPKYGLQFEARTWKESMPATLYGLEKYLSSGLIKGLGPVYTERIIKKFGMNTMKIIESNPKKLMSVPGIGKARAKKIRESWEKQKKIRDIIMFLQQYGASTALAVKIYKAYGDDAIEKIKKNPYQLADDIWGVGFKTADAIALPLGIDRNSYARCRCGILYILNQMSNNGHCYGFREYLCQEACKLLEIEPATASCAVDRMIADKGLIHDPGDGDKLYLPVFYYAEVGVAKNIKRLLNAKHAPLSLPRSVESMGKDAGIEYDKAQIEAVEMALDAQVMVLTGGPGTGKTTVTRGIVQALRMAKLDVRLAAPTGRAAKRMTETVGDEAKTIHRLLEYSPQDNGYQRNESNPLDGDVLIVDESSMVDILLMHSLLKAIPTGTRLILVGDIDQLPSVGAGNVLKDIIDSEAVPVVRLTKIFRQAQSSRIITNAHRINSGQFPDISNGKDSDFFFIEDDDPDHAAAQIVDLVRRRLPKAYKVSPADIQVLAPMKKGTVGVDNLNTVLQAAINPNITCLKRGMTEYRLGDRVMQIKNNYDKDVFNGDIGVVAKVDADEET